MINQLLPFAVCFAVLISPVTAAELKVGDQAPDFEMVGSDGKTYRLSDFKGEQAVVLAWFPRAFTGGCTRECISFREASDKLAEYDVAYFTASTDPVEKNKAFAKSLELDYPILSDPEGKAAQAYGVYLSERNAARRVTFVIGKDGRIQMIDDKVKVAQHAQDIAAALKQLGVAQKSE